jgi:hypothetical protein
MCLLFNVESVDCIEWCVFVIMKEVKRPRNSWKRKNNWFSLSISWFLHPQPEKQRSKTNCSGWGSKSQPSHSSYCEEHSEGTVYTYGALADCATGAMLQIDIKAKHVYYTPLSDHLHGHFIISTLYHSCVLSFSAVPWSFYFLHDSENTNLSIQSTDSTFN